MPWARINRISSGLDFLPGCREDARIDARAFKANQIKIRASVFILVL